MLFGSYKHSNARISCDYPIKPACLRKLQVNCSNLIGERLDQTYLGDTECQKLLVVDYLSSQCLRMLEFPCLPQVLWQHDGVDNELAETSYERAIE